MIVGKPPLLLWELGIGFRLKTTDLRSVLKINFVLARARKGGGYVWNYEYFEMGRFGVKARIEISSSQEQHKTLQVRQKTQIQNLGENATREKRIGEDYTTVCDYFRFLPLRAYFKRQRNKAVGIWDNLEEIRI